MRLDREKSAAQAYDLRNFGRRQIRAFPRRRPPSERATAQLQAIDKTGNGLGQQVDQYLLVNPAQRFQIVQPDMFVDFMNAGIQRPQLDDLGTGRGNEATIGGAAAGIVLGLKAAHRFDRAVSGIDQLAARRQKRIARQPPLQVVFESVFVQDGLSTGLDRGFVEFGAETQIELHLGLAGNDVFGTGTGIDIRHLQPGRRKEPVAVIPDFLGQILQSRRESMDRVFRQLRISHMALNTEYGQFGAQRSAAADADHVADGFIAGSSPTKHQSIFSLRPSNTSTTLTTP